MAEVLAERGFVCDKFAVIGEKIKKRHPYFDAHNFFAMSQLKKIKFQFEFIYFSVSMRLLLSYLLIYLLIYLLYLLTYFLTYLLTYLLNYLLIYLLSYLLT